MIALWTWLCRFAYRRALSGRLRIIPTGLPGNRDPDAVCKAFWPVPKPSGQGPCRGDGHYLCDECEWVDLKWT